MKKLLFLLLSLFPSICYAIPSVTSTTGTVEQDSEVTISGANFGTRSDYATDKPYMCKRFQDFETNLTDDGFFSSFYGSDLNAEWDLSTTGGHTTGTWAKRIYTANRNDSLGYTPSTDVSGTYYTSFWYKQDYSKEGVESNKIWRIGSVSNEYGSEKNYYFSSNAGDASYTLVHYPEYSNVVSAQYSDYTFGTVSAWVFVECLVETGTTSRARIWINGSLKLDSNTDDQTWDFNPFDGNGGYMSLGAQMGYGVGKDYLGFDDYYIDYTQARVVIGDDENYASATHRETQIPHHWTDSAVGITVNQGSFAADDDVYVWVIDSNGNISDQDTETDGYQGYPVTIGGEGATDTTAPAVSGRDPAPDENAVPITSDIVFHLTDAGDGVDQATITCTVEGNDESGDLAITGTSADYTCTLSNGDLDAPLAYGQEVNISITASDLNSNAMETVTYKFYTETPEPPNVPVTNKRLSGKAKYHGGINVR